MTSPRGRPPAQSDQEYAAQQAEYQQQSGGYQADPRQAQYQQGAPQAQYQQGPPQAQYQDTRQAQYEGRRRGGGGAIAGSVLAGVLMIISGAIGFLAGLGMVIKGGFYTFHAGYAYVWTTRNWGWTELAIGAVVFAAGVCVILGMMWARFVGVILATLSAVASFLIIPYYPLYSIVVIAIDLFIIWALVTRGRQRA
jgi:hypothetical protein